ncbi:MinD/ParA family protein [Nocardia tengchongensis]|uniref:MinD/ParA family protein n=1 Tax=Nocardia tengchongensis TaxID=2055889 RepID=UPI0036D18A83
MGSHRGTQQYANQNPRTDSAAAIAYGHAAQRPASASAAPGAAYTPVPPVGAVPPPPPAPVPPPDTGHVYRPLPEAGPPAHAVSAPAVAPIPAPPPLLLSQAMAPAPQGARLPVQAAVPEPAFPFSLTLTPEELLADITARRRAQLRSTTGMRGALNKVGFQLGLSAAEQRKELRHSRIRRQLTTHCQIAMVNVKGGVGRTTVVGALGSTFAALRPDRVVAVDANPDFGDLAGRTSRHPYGLTLRDLARSPHLDAFSAVQSFASITSSDLAVVASPWTSSAVEPLSGPEYLAGVGVLRRHYNLSLIDCGTGVLDSSTETVLRTSDAVVVVTPATVRGVTGAVATLEWLNSHGLHRLAATSVVAIVHQHPAKPMVEIERIEELFATANRPTFRVPYDEHLAEGGEIDLRLLDKETALAFEELAAALADGFPGDHTTGGGRGERW